MSTSDPDKRRRSAGALAAVCGGLAACTSALSVASHNLVAQGACIAAALGLIIMAAAILIGAVRRR